MRRSKVPKARFSKRPGSVGSCFDKARHPEAVAGASGPFERDSPLSGLGFSIVALLLLASCSANPKQRSSSLAPPNIVYIISDDQYFGDLGFMGNEQVLTPNLDKLASQSAFYPNGYVPSSVCRPSLVSLLTGLYPHQHGVGYNHPPPGFQALTQSPDMTKQRYDALREAGAAPVKSLNALPRLLAHKGYRCLQTGKYWEGHWRNAGFTEGMTLAEPWGGPNGDKVLPNGEAVAHGNGDAGLAIGRETMEPISDFLDDCGPEQPFFIWYAPFLPHTPHDSPQRFYQAYKDRGVKPSQLPYYASIAQFDETVGALIQDIEARGLSENTLFVFVVDNGWEALEENPAKHTEKSKRSPFEPGLRTPVLLRWDGVIAPRRIDALVNSIDLFPTSLAAAGVRSEEAPTPGVNLLPSARGEVPLDPNRAIFGEIYPGDATVLENPSADLAYRWARKGNYKLIVPVSRNPWNHYVDTVHLFDLEEDPGETRNLAEDPRFDSRKESLLALLDEWWKP